jgi:beta-glucosidase
MISEKWVDDLVDQMTLKEKVGQLNQHLYGWQCFQKKEDGSYELTQLFKEHVKRFDGIGSIYGLMRSDAWSGMNEVNGILKEDSLQVVTMIQEYIKEHTRLKIPALITEECVHGHQGLHSMMYPANISMGMTWNPELLETICQEVGHELASKGGNIALYAALDVMREPRWGRSEECFSEDAYLISEMTKAAVNGFQSQKQVGVVLKHLCAQGAALGGHNSGAAQIGPRELREIFLPPVEAGAKSKAKGFMAAYNEIDGVPCHVNKDLLTGIVREEYNFNGIIMADGCALDRLLTMDSNVPRTAAKALLSGVDISLWDDVYTHLEEAVKQGYLDEKELNQSVKRVLRLKNEIGLFEKLEIPTYQSHAQELALQAAKECQVLLKNNGLLPLNKKITKIAVIGPNANNKMTMLGDYSSFQKEEDVVTIYEGIKKIVDGTVEVKYALGCQIKDTSYSYMEEAIALAKESDVVIAALGGSSARHFEMEFESNGAVKTTYNKDEMNCGENVDKASLDLDGIQVQLLHELKKVNDNIVTVLIQGRVHSIANIVAQSSAILAAWYPGNFGGEAIAQTLFGIHNPSGRLSMSIPRSSMQLPCYYNGKFSGAKEDYIDMSGKPLFHFGYGLSYSHFRYQNIALSKKEITIKEIEEQGLDITLDIINDSNQDGCEIVQIYIVDKESTITRRNKELKGFKKVFVKKNTKKTISLHLDSDAFKIWNLQMKHVIEPGTIDILVAKNAEEYQTYSLVIQE